MCIENKVTHWCYMYKANKIISLLENKSEQFAIGFFVCDLLKAFVAGPVFRLWLGLSSPKNNASGLTYGFERLGCGILAMNFRCWKRFRFWSRLKFSEQVPSDGFILVITCPNFSNFARMVRLMKLTCTHLICFHAESEA